MKERKIKRLWNGIASLRDYEVDRFIAEGGVIVVCGNERMTLSPLALKHRGFKSSKKRFNSKGKAGQTYELTDYKWVPDRDDQDQMEFQTEGDPK